MTIPIHYEFQDKLGVCITLTRGFCETDVCYSTTDRKLLAKEALSAIFKLVVLFEEGQITRSQLDQVSSVHFYDRKVTMDTLKEYIADGGCVEFKQIKRLDHEAPEQIAQRKADIEQSRMDRIRYVFPRLFVK